MIKFKKVTMSNFLSFGKKPTEILLDGGGATIIFGNNEDIGDTGNSRNGVGKTAYFQAILFALYGKGIDKLKTDEFINIKNGNKLVVELEFEKGGKEYKIIRKRKPNAVEIYVNGESLTLDTMKNTDQAITDILGIDYDVFMTCFMLTPHRESFMSMGAAQQRSIMESMLSLDILAKRADSLKIIRKDLEVEKKVSEREVTYADEMNNKTMADIERLKQKEKDFSSELANEINELEETIKAFQELPLDEIRKEVARKVADDVYNADVNEKVKSLEQELAHKQQELNASSRELQLVEDAENRYNDLLRQSKEYDETRDSKVSALEEEINDLEYELDEQEDILAGLKNAVAIEKELRDVTVQYKELSRQKTAVESSINDIQDKLTALKSGVCYACGQAHIDEDAVQQMENELSEYESEKAKIDEKIEKVSSTKKELETSLDEYREAVDIDEDDSFATVASLQEQEIHSIKASIGSKQNLLSNFRDGVNPFKGQLDNYQKPDNDVKSLQKTIKLLSDDIDTINKSLDDLKNSLKNNNSYPLLEEYDIGSGDELDELVKEVKKLEQSIKDLKKKQNPYTDEVKNAHDRLIDVGAVRATFDELDSDITHIGYLIKLLTDSKSFVRKNIVDVYIPFVNKKILEYTDKLGLMHICSINSDLSSDILYMNKAVSYYNLSQGERLRLNLAVNLAFRDLVTMLGKGSNLIMIDEFLDNGMDKSGTWNAFTLLKDKASDVFIISHREEFKEYADKSMTITKRNGFSIIE